MKIRTVLSITVCALACACRAQTALRGDLRPSDRVVTNEIDATALSALSLTNAILSAAITNEAALREAGDAAGADADALSGTNALLRAAITNEAAIRAGADAALADLVATGRFTRLLESGGADEWISLAAGTATLWRVTETGLTITTNTVTNAVEVVDTVATTNITDTVTTNTAYRGVYVDPGCFWDTNIVFTLQSSVTNIGSLTSMIQHDYGVIDHHWLYWRKSGRTNKNTGELEWNPGQWSAWYYDWETSPPAVVTNLYIGPGEWPDIGNLYANTGFYGAHITMQAVTNSFTYTTNIVTTASTNIFTNIVATVYTNVTAETNAVATYATHADLAAGASAVTNEAALREAGDAAGLDALAATNTVLHTALTNEAALRVAGDAAGLGALSATNTVLHTALTNEAALRVAGDAAGLDALASYADTNRVTRLWEEEGSDGWLSIANGTAAVERVSAATNDGYRVIGYHGEDAEQYYKNIFFSFLHDSTVTNAPTVTRTIIYTNTAAGLQLRWQRAGNTNGTWTGTGTWDSNDPANSCFTGNYTWPAGGTLTDQWLEETIQIEADEDVIFSTNSIPLATIPALAGKVAADAGTATNLNLISEWQTLSGVTGSVTLTNLADRPIQCTGTGAVSLAFSGLTPPQPVYLTLGGFDSVTWPSAAYAVGGWGAWQTNRLNHFAVWQVGTNLYVNQITTSEE